MNTTQDQIFEMVKNMGGSIYDGYAVFVFDNPVSDDGGESITLDQALDVENKMLDAGFEGALIGHPFDESDFSYIHFKL